MAFRPANWDEDLQLKSDMTNILGFLAYQNGGSIKIPYGEILPLVEELGDVKFTLSIGPDGEGGWLVELLPLEEGMLPRVTYQQIPEEHYGPENEAADQT